MFGPDFILLKSISQPACKSVNQMGFNEKKTLIQIIK